MRLKRLTLFLVLLIINKSACALYQWAVVGAGLAGITSVAMLIENKVDPATIIWIDPEFTMGRMGKYYRNVPANTKIRVLKNYFNNCKVLKNFPSKAREMLFSCDDDQRMPLKIIIDPLQDATEHLRNQVISVQDTVKQITSDASGWMLECSSCKISAKKIILAIGAYPKSLDLQLQEIPLDEALDKNKLATYINENDSIAVFGGMHSAMLVLKYLHELGMKKIINFYTTPYQYRIPGAESLDGEVKEWVKTVLEQNLCPTIVRIKSSQENISAYLSLCNKVIYAIGFERNPLLINGSNAYSCDEKTGIISPNLFGIGIAFPPTIKTLKCGKVAINGFAAFSSYARRLIPLWIQS